MNNYTDNPEALLMKSRSHIASSSATPSVVEPVTPVPSATTAMAKTLHDYSTPAVANVPVGPAGKEKKFNFWPRQEQCSMIRIKYGPNPQGIKKVEIQPQLVDSHVKKNKENKKRPE